MMLMTINNPDTGAEMTQAGDVHRGQRPRQRDPGRGSVALHDLVPDGELRPDPADQEARRRARLLHRPHRQSRRARPLPQGHRRRRAHRPRAAGRRQRRRRGRRRRRRPERQRRDRADPQVRARARATCASARATSGCSSRCRPARRATGCSSAAKGSTTTATAASTRIRSAATTATATGRPTGSRTTSRAARWTIRSSCPEARAINDFLMAHPNIAGVQSYHNNGGMILRGPGAEWQGEYPRADVARLRRARRARASACCPYYRYLVIWSGLYTVHGGFIDWTNDGLGMLSFSNELWNGGQYFNSPALVEQQRNPDSPIARRTRGPTTSTTSSSSATSTSSGRRSTIRSSARSRWAAGRRRRAACRRAS